MHRLFIAIDLPASVKATLRSICHGVEGARWVSDAQMHLTLKFVGAADDSLLSRIANALAGIRQPEFPMAVCGVGCFPGEREARVIWAGLKAPPALAVLQKEIDAVLAREGIPPENRPFSPHVTLARIKVPNPREISRFRSRNESFAIAEFTIREFHLYSSVLSPKGPTYTKERSYPLLTTAGPDTP